MWIGNKDKTSKGEIFCKVKIINVLIQFRPGIKLLEIKNGKDPYLILYIALK